MLLHIPFYVIPHNIYSYKMLTLFSLIANNTKIPQCINRSQRDLSEAILRKYKLFQYEIL